MSNDTSHNAANAFEQGLNNIALEKSRTRKMRRSKLEAASVLIISYWTAGKSLGFIQLRLESEGITCSRSTILRFIQRSLCI